MVCNDKYQEQGKISALTLHKIWGVSCSGKMSACEQGCCEMGVKLPGRNSCEVFRKLAFSAGNQGD